MINSYKEIEKVLKAARLRVVLKALVNHLFLGISGALLLSTLLALVSRVTPIYGVYKGYIITFLCIGIVLAIIVTFGSIPSLKKIAKLVDSFGLKERIATALELENEENIYKELLIKDAVKVLKSLNYEEHISIIPKKRLLIVFLSLTLIFGGTFLIPDYQKGEAEKIHALKIEKKAEEKKIEEMKKQVEDNKNLSEDDKKELLTKLEELKKELKEAKESIEINKAEEKFAKKLELDKNKNLEKDLEKLAENLKKDESSKELAEALKAGDKDKVKEELDKLKDIAKNLDSKSKESLKKNLANSAKSSSSTEMKEALNDLSESLESSDENALTKSVDNVKGPVNKALANKDKNNAVAELQKQLEGEQQGDKYAQAEANEEGEGSGQNAQGSGQSGEGNGQGQGNGNGQGQGSGNGNGSEGSGGGAGAGSSGGGGDAGTNPYSSGGIASKDPSEGKEREYERVFTPNNLGGDGNASNLNGKAGQSGSSESTITNDSNATLGEFKPYNQVIGEYSSKAMENLNSYDIPEGMMEIIKNYFTSLEE
jgi:hypothetical protein